MSKNKLDPTPKTANDCEDGACECCGIPNKNWNQKLHFLHGVISGRR